MLTDLRQTEADVNVAQRLPDPCRQRSEVGSLLRIRRDDQPRLTRRVDAGHRHIRGKGQTRLLQGLAGRIVQSDSGQVLGHLVSAEGRSDRSRDLLGRGAITKFSRELPQRDPHSADRDLPGLSDDEHRHVLDERLREQAAIEAEDHVGRQEQARAKRTRRDAVRTASAERAEGERQAAATADAVRQALAYEDCGQQQAGGLCEGRGYRRQTEALVVADDAPAPLQVSA